MTTASAALRVAVVTPNDTDASLTQSFLREVGITADPLPLLSALSQLLEGNWGCIVLVEESLVEPEIEVFQQALARQPAWSDLPLLLIAAHETSMAALGDRIFPAAGNITLLQRPLHPVSLISAVQVAFRARRRQLEVRHLLEQRAEALRQRDEFLAMLAHELRNPLTPVRNAVYMLNKLEIEDSTFVKARELIDNQVKHMARLVDDLLDVSRLEVGKVELRLKDLDLSTAISSAVEASLTAARARNHELKVIPAEDPLWICADPVRVEQIISNLIVNAAKFTPPGGRITISARRLAQEAVVTVEDTGIGIRPEMKEAIFELFRQDDSSLARSGGGLGIGLTVVKRLMELHNGSIAVHSDGFAKGSAFEIRFPLVECFETAQPQEPETLQNAPQKRVLIVEDNDDIRESLRMLVMLWGHEVVCAASGLEGVGLASEFQPDIALVDIGLPGLNGYGVARQIRQKQTAWSDKVKLVALTGYGQPSDKEKAIQVGFDLHLLKPVDPDVLERLLCGQEYA